MAFETVGLFQLWDGNLVECGVETPVVFVETAIQRMTNRDPLVVKVHFQPRLFSVFFRPIYCISGVLNVRNKWMRGLAFHTAHFDPNTISVYGPVVTQLKERCK